MLPLLALLLSLGSLSQLNAAQAASEPAPLAIGLYFEALCPDSRNFVVNQLNITYSQVPDILEVTFVPWGKAYIGNDSQLYCQHGPEECWGNRLLDCAASAAPSEAAQVGVIACLMDKQKSLHEDGPACVEAAGLSWEEQTDCAASFESYQRALQFGQLTAELDPPVSFIPTVTLDGSQGSADQQAALVSDFLATVCTVWRSRYGETPASCP